jgi:hypothetical protein
MVAETDGESTFEVNDVCMFNSIVTLTEVEMGVDRDRDRRLSWMMHVNMQTSFNSIVKPTEVKMFGDGDGDSEKRILPFPLFKLDKSQKQQCSAAIEFDGK